MDAFEYFSAVADRVIATRWGPDSAQWLAAEARIVEVSEVLGGWLEANGFRSTLHAGQLPWSEQEALSNAISSCIAMLFITDPARRSCMRSRWRSWRP